MALSDYSYPRLKTLPHYGDWKAEFESGTLVYYERCGSDYGFYGANVSTLSDTAAVTGDGYGMIYETLPAGDVIAAVDGVQVTLKKAAAVPVRYGEETYYLLPLPAEVVNTATPPAKFYQTVDIEGRTYYYNPHFASTVTAGETMPAPPEQVMIRTARQLYNLSRYYGTYAMELSANCTFLQGRDVDYTAYDWKNYGAEGKTVSVQQPIGASADLPFSRTYNGGYHRISGVSFLSETGADYVGLFGYNTGDLRNIVLAAEPDRAEPSELPVWCSGKPCMWAHWRAGTAAASITAPPPDISSPAAHTAAVPSTSARWWVTTTAPAPSAVAALSYR